MKKVKIDKPIVPISLSAKKSRPQPEVLFTPCKVQWKQKDDTSFFASMKNQLSTIKNDVEKLIKKQNEKSEVKTVQAIEVIKEMKKKYIICEKAKEKQEKRKQGRALVQKTENNQNCKVKEPYEKVKKEISAQKAINEDLKRENYNLYEKNQIASEILQKKEEEISYYKDNILKKMNEENHQLNKKNRDLLMELEVITHKFNDQELLIRQIRQHNSALSEQIIKKDQHNIHLINEIKKLEATLTEKQTHKEKHHNIEKISIKFEQKINKMVEENYQLKNTINKMLADIQKLEFQKKAYLETIEKYQERNQQEKEKLSKDEKIELYEEIQSLKREKQTIIDDYEYQLMKLQNKYDQIRKVNSPRGTDNSENSFINKALKEQITENQKLKQKIKENQVQIGELKEEVKEMGLRRKLLENEQSKLSQSARVPQNKYENVCAMMEEKNKQIRAKDEFIQKVLISKISKKESEDQVEYLMKELKTILP